VDFNRVRRHASLAVLVVEERHPPHGGSGTDAHRSPRQQQRLRTLAGTAPACWPVI